MKQFTIIRKNLSNEEIRVYTRLNPGYIATGDTIECEYTNYYGQEVHEHLVIFKAADARHYWTPMGMARQTSKYIIIARHSSYWKLTKNGKIISLDAEDDNNNK